MGSQWVSSLLFKKIQFRIISSFFYFLTVFFSKSQFCRYNRNNCIEDIGKTVLKKILFYLYISLWKFYLEIWSLRFIANVEGTGGRRINPYTGRQSNYRLHRFRGCIDPSPSLKCNFRSKQGQIGVDRWEGCCLSKIIRRRLYLFFELYPGHGERISGRCHENARQTVVREIGTSGLYNRRRGSFRRRHHVCLPVNSNNTYFRNRYYNDITISK